MHATLTRKYLLLGLLVVTWAPSAAWAQGEAPAIVDATAIDVRSQLTSVTLYRGRAAVTRVTEVALQSGVYELRFSGLPESVQAQSLQVRTAVGLKVLSVDYVQEAAADPAASPDVTALDGTIRSLTQSLRTITDQRDLIKSQEDFLTALATRTAVEAAGQIGAAALDLEAVKEQMDFITAERKRLQAERALLEIEQPRLEAQLGAARANREAAVSQASVTRTAIVSVVAADPFTGEVSLTYLVTNATWEPAYNVRAATDFSSAQIEYNAVLTQRTGEDWTDVRLLLSTAQPTVAANPPEVEPWYVDIFRPELERGRADLGDRRAAAPEDMEAMKAPMNAEVDKATLEVLAREAEVAGGGPSVTFELPRAITVKTNIDRQQSTRIATFNASPSFVHVAMPLLTDAVYVRGDLANPSAYHLLPGRASIFLGQDYVGPTVMPSVTPGGEFKLHFGVDQSVRARRQLVSRINENTGLLSGGRRTDSRYRIGIDNGSGRNIILELWDRIPVSRTEDIQVQLVDLSTPLASDAYYLGEQRPQGLLKWWLTVPPTSRDRNALAITWGVRVDRAKDVVMTPLPE